MKNKATCFIISIFFVFSLCGCKGYREADSSYIVTAMGFDGKKKITVSVEVVSAGGSERSNKPTSDIISGKGDTPMEAVFSLNSRISKNLLFDHCTAIIIGRDLSETHLGEVLKYGNELKELNFDVDMFICKNAKNVLEKSKSVSVSRGFDISSNLKETNKEIGIDYQNKFYEVYKAYKAKENYSLPFLKVSDKKLVIEGQCIFKNKSEKAYLDNEEALLYSFFTNNNNGGKIYIGEEYADIRGSKCRLNKNKRQYEISLNLKNQSDGFKKVFKKNTEKMLRKKSRELGITTKSVVVKERKGY